MEVKMYDFNKQWARELMPQQLLILGEGLTVGEKRLEGDHNSSVWNV